MKAIWTIARRELGYLFDHPTGYILLVVFVGVNNFLFFRQVYLMGVASLRPMLDILPWLLLFVVPAVAMRVLAEDTRTGTIEVVLAQPITELELVLGKYLGAVLFLLSALAATLLIPVGLSLGADMAVGVVIAQYVGASLLIAGFTGVGVWASALTRNQISAFIIAVAVMFLLILVGLNQLVVGLPPRLGALAARLGVLSHFANIGRGVVDLRDVVYFVSLAAVFLIVAYGVIMGRRLAWRSPQHNRLRLGVTALVAVAVVVNLLGGYIGGRLDLTPGNAYTLSNPTRELVAGVDDIVTMKLFVSKELPAEIALLKRDIDDLLRDLRSASGGTVRVAELDPADDDEAMDEARSLGIPPVRFNVVGESQLEIREGYMGMAIRYADQVETIPLIRRTDDLEYRIASAIRGMTRTDTAVVAIANVGQTPGAPRAFQALREQLRAQYSVRTATLPSDSGPDDDVDVLVIAGEPDSLPESQVDRLRAFVQDGGGLLVMTSGIMFDTQRPFVMPRPVSWNTLLADYGVEIESNIVYDLQANERVSLPTQFGRLFVAYPFWVRAASTNVLTMNEQIGGIFLPWTSGVDISAADSGTATPLFVSSQAASAYDVPTILDPQRDFATDSLSTRLLAAAVVPQGEEDGSPPGRIVVVGNDDFASDRNAQSAPENLAFVLNAVDWLAQDEALSRIRAKDRRPPTLTMSDGERDGVKYANLIGMPVVIVLAGLGRLVRRRKTTRKRYHSVAREDAP